MIFDEFIYQVSILNIFYVIRYPSLKNLYLVFRFQMTGISLDISDFMKTLFKLRLIGSVKNTKQKIRTEIGCNEDTTKIENLYFLEEKMIWEIRHCNRIWPGMFVTSGTKKKTSWSK